MKAIEIYKRILDKINLNDTNRNIRVPLPVAVLTFNEQAELWLSNFIKEKNSTDEINAVSEFLIPDTELTKAGDNSDSADFILPTDFLEYSSSYSVATKGECKNRVIVNWDIKNKNVNTILPNSNESPSFEYEETPVKLANKRIKVYRKDFKVNKVFLDYYQIPAKIDIEGYISFDGTNSKNIDSNFSDWATNQIISKTVLALTRNFQNIEGFKLAQERVATDK